MKRIKKIIGFFLPGFHLPSILISAGHALWMILFSLIWLAQVNMFDGFDFMNDVMDYRDLVKNEILKIESKSDINERFFLINTSKSNQIQPLDNDNSTNSVITDRKKLAETLLVLDSLSSDFRFIICDIFFEDLSANLADDSLLQEAIRRLNEKNKIVIPCIYNNTQNSFINPVFKCTLGTSQYKSSFLNDQYLKFSYILADTVKQMPLVAYEKITGNRMQANGSGIFSYYTINNKWCLNTIIPEFRYTQADLTEDVTYFQLGYFSKYMLGNNQIIVIGDFEGIYDRHHSMIDQVPGPLAVVNAYMAIERGDNVISVWYLLLLFTGFFYISYHSFFKSRINPVYEKRQKTWKVLIFFRKRINYIIIMLLALVSMVGFHFYIHLLILLSYFGVIEYVLFNIQEFRRKRKIKQNKKLAAIIE